LITALVVVLVLIVRAVFFSQPPPPPVRTVTVQRGTVRSVVAGSGTVEPVSQQNVSFRQEGQVSELLVKIGDHVRAGQVLARIVPDALRAALQQAQGGLQTAQATLNNTVQQNTVQTAENNLEAAVEALGDVRRQVSKTIKATEDRIASDERKLAFDKQTLDRHEDILDRDQAVLARDRANLLAAQSKFVLDGCTAAVQLNPSACTADQTAIDQAKSAVSADVAKVEQDIETVRADKATVLADQAQLSADKRQLEIDRANGRKSINDAEAAVVSARDALISARITRRNTIAENQGSVTTAQAEVATAQQNLNDATLRSPFDGTVLAINARQGEQVSTSGQTTPLAPGTTAPQPATATAVAPAGQAGASGGQVASPFIVLGDVRAFQVIVPFAEADASRLRPGLKAEVTFDAIPGLRVPADVIAVAPGATIIQNVTNYFATLTLAQIDPRLRAGLTANAEIVASEVHNVLVVPNAAVQRVGNQAFVTVLLRDGTQRRMLVQTGLVGDTTTEVIAGLEPGDRVVLPTVRGAGQPPRTGPGPGGG
jgi:HlyD family secretion protein